MMYKNPILKSKKKEPAEVDITDLSESARSKIVRASELPIAVDVKGTTTKLPDESLDHAFRSAKPDLSDLICVCDPIQFVFEGGIFPPCQGPNLLRGRYGKAIANFGDMSGSFTCGYISKEIFWVDEGGIWTERFTDMPESGTLTVIKNNGDRRQPINVTSKRDFEVKVNQYGKTVLKWEDEENFHETWMFKDEYVKGTRFTTTNNVGALPGERVVLWDTTDTDPPGVVEPYTPLQMWYWYAHAASPSGNQQDDYTVEYFVTMVTRAELGQLQLIQPNYLIELYDRKLRFLNIHITPIYEEDDIPEAKFNGIKYSFDEENNLIEILDADDNITSMIIEIWFRSEEANVQNA